MLPHQLSRGDAQDDAGRLAAAVVSAGRVAGLVSVGTAPVAVFAGARRHLERRKRHGLHGGMQFTYRNPARATDPSRLLAGARSLVVGAWAYPVPVAGCRPPAEDPNGVPAARPRGRVARYAARDHYRDLQSALDAIAAVVTAAGWRARVVVDDNGLVDREAARRARVGVFGKSTVLLVPGHGSWCLLGSVVTDAPLRARWSGDVDAPPRVRSSRGACGRCTACLDACPTGALVAPGVLDARRCLAWLLQAGGTFPLAFRDALGDRLYGCDTCQDVCPLNRVAGRRTAGRDGSGAPDGPAPEGAGPSDDGPGAAAGGTADDPGEIDLVDLLESSDEEVMARAGRWYVAGRDPAVVRRNALVALGNTGRADDPATARVLGAYLGHPDPVLREHAAWAARRVGLLAGDAPGAPVALGAAGGRGTAPGDGPA